MILAVQLATPFDADLPATPVLAPRIPRQVFAPVRERYPEILQRPIFAEDRQPMMELLQGYALLGTGIAGPLSTAVVQTTGGRMQRVKPGERLGGWQVTAITETNLFLARNKERRMLRLDMTRVAIAPRQRQISAVRPKAASR